MTVHPRSRGEHRANRALRAACTGSSPLARGTPDRRHARDLSVRFIPARAGNTSTAGELIDGEAVHPRSRGEHRANRALRAACTGSSPLARGTLVAAVPSTVRQRFIPARAGNTCQRTRRGGPEPVHPRSRGEHYAREHARRRPVGSSPLARGTRCYIHVATARIRFIPARAGNTLTDPLRGEPPPVHPRSRGEHYPEYDSLDDATGSSPLARGTQSAGGGEGAEDRFIPARAGNTPEGREEPEWSTVHPRSRGEHRECTMMLDTVCSSSPLARGTPGRPVSPRPGRPVHPRSRGEHATALRNSVEANGSSPLARGTQCRAGGSAQERRFIPARAGNTGRRRKTPPSGPVHPRSRGEHGNVILIVSVEAGSSPLARGTPIVHDGAHGESRFIPARAGNTLLERSRGRGRAVHPRSRGEHSPPRVAAWRGRRFIPARAGNT